MISSPAPAMFVIAAATAASPEASVMPAVGSCLINRRRAGPRFVDDLTCVNLQRFKFVILIAHKRDPLYFFRDVESDKQQIKKTPP